MKRVLSLLLSLSMALVALDGCGLAATAVQSANNTTGRVANNAKLRMRRTFRTMGARSFSRLIARKNVQVLDVRTAREYRADHVVGANGCLNISFQKINFVNLAKRQLDPSMRVAVYCRSGVRGARAAEQLSRAGFRVVNLQGGMQSWIGMGYPTANTLHGRRAIVADGPVSGFVEEEE